MLSVSTKLQFIFSHLWRINSASLLGILRHAKNKRYIQQYLPNHAVIVEAGAHIGIDTADMAKRWPDATIHAFEPVPELFAKLTKNTKQYPNVKRYPFALSDTNGYATLHISSGASDEASSLLSPKEHLTILPTVAFKTRLRVKTMTLDTWAKKYAIDTVHFMWLDMQGMEYNVLKQSTKIFPKVRLLYTEVNVKENYAGVMIYPQYKAWLIAQGMKPALENIYWKDQGNALFVRPK